MSHIHYTATIQTMGDATDDYAARYVDELKIALTLAFPDADVRVDRDDRQSSSSYTVSTDIDVRDVNDIANRVWNDANF